MGTPGVPTGSGVPNRARMFGVASTGTSAPSALRLRTRMTDSLSPTSISLGNDTATRISGGAFGSAWYRLTSAPRSSQAPPSEAKLSRGEPEPGPRTPVGGRGVAVRVGVGVAVRHVAGPGVAVGVGVRVPITAPTIGGPSGSDVGQTGSGVAVRVAPSVGVGTAGTVGRGVAVGVRVGAGVAAGVGIRVGASVTCGAGVRVAGAAVLATPGSVAVAAAGVGIRVGASVTCGAGVRVAGTAVLATPGSVAVAAAATTCPGNVSANVSAG